VARPIVTPDEYAATEASVEAFRTSSAPQLQAQLEKIDGAEVNSEVSWFHNFHNDMYMEARFPTYIYKNPAGVLKTEVLASSGISGQIDLAAHLIAATIVFMDSVINETLEPDVFKGFPLDMLQYSRMVAATRIPKQNRDVYAKAEDPSKIAHIIVTRGSNFYKIAVKNKSCEQIKSALNSIVNSDETLSQPSVGVLTCDNRDLWATNRETLLNQSNKNRNSLKDIDEALFVICLDPPLEASQESLSTAMRAAMHGNPRHRWFDKPVQLIVTAEGKLCSNAEHSWGDGICMARWGEELVKEIKTPTYNLTGGEPCAVELIEWDTNEKLLRAIESAGREADLLAKKWVCANREFTEFGSSYLKANGFSPDATLQQVLQLAYRKMHTVSVSQYSVAATMAFKAGRNDRIRSNTPECKAFVDAVMGGEGETKHNLKQTKMLLKKATQRHSGLSQMCSMGRGIDRHLYCLYKLAEQRGGELEDIFTNKAFTTLMTDTMCSTNLNVDFIEAMMVNPAFSDFTNDGGKEKEELAKYMCPYSTFADRVKFVVCGFEGVDCEKFMDCIFESMKAVKKIIEGKEEEQEGEEEEEKKEQKTEPEPNMRQIMASAMRDPDLANALGNPVLQPIVNEIMKTNGKCLQNPLEHFKTQLAASPELAAMAMVLLPKLSALLVPPSKKKEEEERIAHVEQVVAEEAVDRVEIASVLKDTVDKVEMKAVVVEAVNIVEHQHEQKTREFVKSVVNEAIQSVVEEIVLNQEPGGLEGAGEGTENIEEEEIDPPPSIDEAVMETVETEETVEKVDSVAKYTQILARAMKDPAIASQFQNPKLRPIMAKIMQNPTCLRDPMTFFKNDLKDDPELAEIAATLLPQLANLITNPNR